ncbi:MAG: L-histidine N(alpha)-methyltransferase [Candidatus Thiodiazotropha lotti]|uniref:L-histidine N(Alpha)-methyltransferase n=1 Tax=Candidatus Thiodiazotropha lotti TaxID=2792787 RepID=A0A9E4N047_9GAMM|nr:L-histidine N(alpha)-methyltransferase [Candidatus Thiodiazotropha lotti]MCW4204646.1 L-histidine N(alpha)-methyltransferase [Candidatus Thiodiazotropha lotti]
MRNVTFHDHKQQALSFLDAVVEGLSQENKSIPPKFFYDERGSELFDRICEQPEYYPPSVERKMLCELSAEIASLTGQNRLLIEPGVGNGAKVRLLLDDLKPSAFVPMDISFDYLKTMATQLAAEYPWLPVHAACVDFSHSLLLPDEAPDSPRLVFFPGSSLGNFDMTEAEAFLKLVREVLGEEGMLLIGLDTKKPEYVLNAAYNDAAGVTAEFNKNLLHRMRDELKIEVDPRSFDHHAFYNAAAGRIEMHLVSKRDQLLHLNGFCFEFEQGESLHTENSYKYEPEEFLDLASKAGMVTVRHWLAEEGLFGIYLLETTALG